MKSSHLFFIILAVFIANISTVQGLKFTLEILGLERVCFYEVLSIIYINYRLITKVYTLATTKKSA